MTRIALAWLMLLPASLWASTMTGYVGTYTVQHDAPNGSAGIYRFHWDSDNGTLSDVTVAGHAVNPSYLVISPNGRFLYAVNESGDADSDRITAFAMPARGSDSPLTDLGSVAAMGQGPCHLAIDARGRWVFAANYRSGTIAVFPVQKNGRLGAATQTVERSKQARAHQTLLSPDGRFLLAVDLGLDRIFVYRFDAASGRLTAMDSATWGFPSGYGPRHLIFSKDARSVYVLTELNGKLVTLHWDAANGKLTPKAEISALPLGDTSKPSAAEIALSADGRYLYTSNRGDSNSIAVFRIGHDGIPFAVDSVGSGGQTPRFIGIDPSGRFLLAANQNSNTVIAFRIDSGSGRLSPRSTLVIPAPVDVVFDRRQLKGSR